MNHVDPETLAAWADGTLSPVEATAVESHLADCPQCRAVSAAFARTLEPAAATSPVPSAAPASTPSSFTKWMLPFAATLVISAGLVWKLWPREVEPVDHAAAETVAQSAPLQPTLQQPPAQPPAPAITAPPQVQQRPASKQAKAEPKMTPKVATDTLPAAPAPPALSQPLPAAMAAPPPPAAQPPPVAQTVFSDRWKVIDFVSAPNPLFANTGGGAGRGGSARASAVTRSGQVRWRASGPASVERSHDGGATWVPVAIEAAGAVLVAGTAPSPEVCWLVGRAGIVLLSRNGGSFTRVAFPEPVDLMSVLAASDLEATVVAADGRAFVTTDGGKTWRARF